MLILKNNKEVKKIINEEKKVLYLIKPGLFLNEDLFTIYDKIDHEIKYECLLDWMCKIYSGNRSEISKKLNVALHLLNKRGLVDFIGFEK